MALLLPSVQAARAAARRVQCANNLKQIALAAHEYHSTAGTLPPGILLSQYYPSRARYRGANLFVFLLPHLDAGSLCGQWDFVDPNRNFDGGTDSRAAKGPNLLCPAEPASENPLYYSSRLTGSSLDRYIKVTSYAGNGGTRSYHPASGFLMTNGVFFMAGPGSRPQSNQEPVRFADITDGTTNTLFFGERSRWDPNYDTFAAQGWDWEFRYYGNWAATSASGVAHVTLSSYPPINYRLPFNYDNRATANPPANSAIDFKYYIDLRVCAYGSSHPGGANLAMCDGSVRFFSESTNLMTFRALSTRGGGEVVPTP